MPIKKKKRQVFTHLSTALMAQIISWQEHNEMKYKTEHALHYFQQEVNGSEIAH